MTSDTKAHAFWGEIQRDNHTGHWSLTVEEDWSGKGRIKIRFGIEDPENGVVQTNYQKIRERWSSIWPRIVKRTEEMKASYGYSNTPINFGNDWIAIRLPKAPIDEGGEWNSMLQSVEAGWLVDFKGWNDFGGQGVF